MIYNQINVCRTSAGVDSRLAFISGYLCRLMPFTFDRVKELDDHKGFLTVSWKFKPTRMERYTVGRVWEDVGNEIAENVGHKWPGGSNNLPDEYQRRIMYMH